MNESEILFYLIKNAVFDARAYRESQYDKLADAVRGALDMELIYRILEEGV